MASSLLPDDARSKLPHRKLPAAEKIARGKLCVDAVAGQNQRLAALQGHPEALRTVASSHTETRGRKRGAQPLDCAPELQKRRRGAPFMQEAPPP